MQAKWVKSGFLMIVPIYAKVSQLKTGIFSRKVLTGCVCSDDASQAINDALVSMVLLMSMDSCERTVETVEFADVLLCKKSSIRHSMLIQKPMVL
jgi:hypothetical protein